MVAETFEVAKASPQLDGAFKELLHATPVAELPETPMAKFGQYIEQKFKISFSAKTTPDRYDAAYYQSLHRWTVKNVEDFWPVFIEYSGIEIEHNKGDPVFEALDYPPYGRYFPKAKFSYAENILKYWIAHPDEKAFVYRHQIGTERIITGQDLCDQVSRWEQALRDAGVGEGDVVGLYVDNAPDAEFVAIAAANLGASMCSAGADLGAQAVINRFEDNKPKILIATQGTVFGGKAEDKRPEIAKAQKALPSVEKTILLPAPNEDAADPQGLENTVVMDAFLKPYAPQKLIFKKYPFDTVGLLINSSGSTGKPKTFKHGYASSLIEHALEHRLYMGVKQGSVVACETSKSWMVSNAMKTSTLADGATVLSFDGDPFFEDPQTDAHMKLCADFKATHICTSAAAHNARMDKGRPNQTHLDLGSVENYIYTGGVLSPDAQRKLQHYIGRPVNICSWAGGGDINGGFFLGTAMLPQYAGHAGVAVLGKDIRIIDPETGAEVAYGQAGELVCFSIPFSAPLALVGDNKARSKQEKEYYREGNIWWWHGDEIRYGLHGNVIYNCRTDEVHNQNDIKVSPQQLKEIIERVSDAKEEMGSFVTVNFTRPDTNRPLTVLCYTGALSEDKRKKINNAINEAVGRGAAPAETLHVPEIPITKSGKLVNVLLGKIIDGRTPEQPAELNKDTFEAFQKAGENLRTTYAKDDQHPDRRAEVR